MIPTSPARSRRKPGGTHRGVALLHDARLEARLQRLRARLLARLQRVALERLRLHEGLRHAPRLDLRAGGEGGCATERWCAESEVAKRWVCARSTASYFLLY